MLAPKLTAQLEGIDSSCRDRRPAILTRTIYGAERRIWKHGSWSLGKIGYEIMRHLKRHKASEDAAICEFIFKKESEGKSKRAAKIAGFNKSLGIHYTRVMEVCQQ